MKFTSIRKGFLHAKKSQRICAANAAMGMWQEVGFMSVHKRIETSLDYLIQNLSDDVMVSPKQAGKHGATLVVSPKDRQVLRDRIKANEEIERLYNLLDDFR